MRIVETVFGFSSGWSSKATYCQTCFGCPVCLQVCTSARYVPGMRHQVCAARLQRSLSWENLAGRRQQDARLAFGTVGL